MNTIKNITKASQEATDVLNQWAFRINFPLAKGIEKFMEAGKFLLAAKRELKHGEFKKLFSLGLLKVDMRTAQMLMRISKNEALSNANNYALLPPALASLNVLAGIDHTKLQQALNEKRLTGAMTIAQVKRFIITLDSQPDVDLRSDIPESKSILRPPDLDPGAADFDLDKSLGRIQGLVDRERKKCPEQLLQLFEFGLRSLA